MSDWYQRRFGGGQQGATTASPPPRVPPPPQQPQPSQHKTGRPALSSLQETRCPACASTNYMAAPGTQLQRCFDCGYPVVQAGTGVGGVSNASDGKVHKATQVQGSGFNPTVIVGRVE